MKRDEDWERATLSEMGGSLSMLRKQAGKNQAFVADNLKTKATSISRLENGRVNASWLTVCRYAALMGYRIEFHKDNRSRASRENDDVG